MLTQTPSRTRDTVIADLVIPFHRRIFASCSTFSHFLLFVFKPGRILHTYKNLNRCRYLDGLISFLTRLRESNPKAWGWGATYSNPTPPPFSWKKSRKQSGCSLVRTQQSFTKLKVYETPQINQSINSLKSYKTIFTTGNPSKTPPAEPPPPQKTSIFHQQL